MSFWKIKQDIRDKRRKEFIKKNPNRLKVKPYTPPKPPKKNKQNIAFELYKDNVIFSAQNKMWNKGVYNMNYEDASLVSKQYIKIVNSKSSNILKEEYKRLLILLDSLIPLDINFYEDFFYNNK